MTQEEKELLLKDLCARLPYETRVRYTYAFAGAAGINEYSDEGTLSYDKLQDFSLPNVGYERRRVICILPYLRPMSSMTEEECDMVEEILGDNCIFDFMSNGDIILKQGQFSQKKLVKLYDYYNSIHIDYRGLISMGLALEAPEGMYTLNK